MDQPYKTMKISSRNFLVLKRKLKKLFQIIKLEQWN